MSEMPERIWAARYNQHQMWFSSALFGTADTEYVRAEIEQLKEAMWVQHDRNVELSKAIERLRKALEQAIDYETPRDTSIADWWECYLVECENELMGSESNYSNMFDWPDELTDELRKRERVY